MKSFIVALLAAAGLSGGIFLSMVAAQSDPAAPQILVLKTIQIDVSQLPKPGKRKAPIPFNRHFADPTSLGQIKQELADESAVHQAHHTPKPTPTPKSTPTPTPAPTSTPTSTPTPTPLSISHGVSNPALIATHFDAMGLLDGGGYEPPDTTVGAGSTFLLEAVNALGTVYNRSGSALVTLNTPACTTNSSTDAVSDPRVLFDTASGRWFISTTTFSPIGDASWNLLFSPGSDPTAASWNCLIIPTSGIRNPDGTTGNFADFPKTGMNGDKIVMTGDAFSPSGSSYKFEGTQFVVINKSELLSLSATLHVALFPPNQGDFAIEPAQQLDSTNEILYMAAVNSALTSTSSIDVWAVSGVPTATTSPTLKITSLPIATISTPPNAQQLGTSVLIDTNDDGLLDAVFRDGSSGSLWVSANDACKAPGDTTIRSCMRFINVAISAGMSIAQDFDYADVGTHYYYPAIRTDKNGNLYTAFSGSSSNTYPSAYAGMQLFGNANVLTNLSMTRAGDSPYTISPPRWGDYSGSAVDPDDVSAWLGAEYATSFIIIGPMWGTEIAHVHP